MRITVLTPIKHIEGLSSFLESWSNVNYCENCDEKTVKRMIADSDAIFVNPNSLGYVLNERVLKGSSVKVIATASTGTNHIDKLYCDSFGINIISATMDYDILRTVSATAEHAFALMLSIIRNIPSSFIAAKNFQWDYSNFIGRQIRNLKVGVVGYGRLGSMFSDYCSAFGADVYVCDPYKSCAYTRISLSEVCSICDVVSLHVHLNDETLQMIGEPEIKLMNGTYLINTSRGDIVNENDVIDGLRDGKIKGYATDVLSDELSDIKISPILLNVDKYNIIVTPHIGGMTVESQAIVYFHVAQKLKNWFNS